MATQRIIIAGVVCFAMAVLTGQTFSWASASNPKPMPLFPPAKSLQGLTDEEKAKAIEKWRAEREKQQKQMRREHINRMAEEAWKRLLKVTEQQWKIFEPKVDKVIILYRTTGARALYGVSGREQRFSWYRHSEGAPLIRAKTPDEMTEGEKLADELVNLLEDENSKDEEIRKKIDELQRVRDKTRKELAQVGRELAALPMTPRQEAIFLIMGYID